VKEQVVEVLKNGGIAVVPTDTIYGLVGQALNQQTIERIYKTRERNPGKPCIVLIASLDDLLKFNVRISVEQEKFLKQYWPGKVSVVLPVLDPQFEYLSRGTKTLAFRIPDHPELLELLTQTGPLVAPSANKEGESASKTIEEARAVFGDNVDAYVDGGVLDSLPSTLVTFENDKLVVLRQGAVEIEL